MACVQTFKAFLKSRETGLIQKSAEWAKARQETVGASEISVLTGSSPFETKETLISKKICPADMSKNVACTWGFLFEPIVRSYFQEKYSVKVFGHTMSLNLAKGHPLYGKVTCSPDGYFSYKDESISLLEFKCPYKRKIAVYQIPRQYADQIQTGLALSGTSVNKGLFVDACFRMCSFKQHSSKEIHTNPYSSYMEFENDDHWDEWDFLKRLSKEMSGLQTVTSQWPSLHGSCWT